MNAPKSTKEHNSRNNTDHGGDESTQDESRENAADSDLELASGDCLTCSDTEEPAIRMAWKRFHKRVWACCSITRGCLWSEAQVRQIKDSHQAIWDSDLQIVRTEWLITPEQHWNNSMPTSTNSMKRVQLRQWSASKGYTWVMLPDAPTSQPAWD